MANQTITSSDIQTIVQQVTRQTVERGGATYSLHDSRFVEPRDEWYYPRHPNKTSIAPVENLAIELTDFLERHFPLLQDSQVFLGTWIDTATNLCYIDITTAQADKDLALNQAKKLSYEQGRNILAIYNPYRDMSIDVETGQSE